MTTFDLFRDLALSLPETTQDPHFEKTSFRVKKKIFVTYDEKLKRACVKLSQKDQTTFCTTKKNIFYPAPNTWGKQGWTFIDLEKAVKDVLMDALTASYCEVAPTDLVKIVTLFRRRLV